MSPEISEERQSLLHLVSQHPSITQVPLKSFEHPQVACARLDLSGLLSVADAERAACIEIVAQPSDSEDHIYGLVRDFVAAYQFESRLKLIYMDEPSSAVRRLILKLEKTALLTREDIARIGSGESLYEVLKSTLLSCIGISSLSPYKSKGPVVGGSFFDRAQSLTEIVERQDRAFLITGPRVSGKTSFLLEAKRRIELSSGDLVIHVECSSCPTMGRLMLEIMSAVDSFLGGSSRAWDDPRRRSFFYKRLRSVLSRLPNKRLRIFLDEYDRVLELESSSGERFTWSCREVWGKNQLSKGFVQFVFAGSKRIEEEARRHDGPLVNFTHLLPIRNFKLDTVRSMISEPMTDLGIEVRNLETTAQLALAETAGRPASIQLLCELALERAVAKRQPFLSDADMKAAIADHRYVREHALLLDENADDLEKLVLARYAGQTDEVFSADDVLEMLEQGEGILVEERAVQTALENLLHWGFLVYDFLDEPDRGYRVALPVVKRIFRVPDLTVYTRRLIHKGMAIRLDKEL